jgi:hypothetical protein
MLQFYMTGGTAIVGLNGTCSQNVSISRECYRLTKPITFRIPNEGLADLGPRDAEKGWILPTPNTNPATRTPTNEPAINSRFSVPA